MTADNKMNLVIIVFALALMIGGACFGYYAYRDCRKTMGPWICFVMVLGK